MQRTRYKNLVLFIFMVFISSVAYAEKGDNTAAPSAGDKPAVLNTTSYFQGTWVGNWEYQGKAGRDITIAVGPKNPDGTFDIEYSWGPGQDPRGRSINPGTVKDKGREDGGKMILDYYDPVVLSNMTIVMNKYEDDRAKANMEGLPWKPVAYLRRK